MSDCLSVCPSVCLCVCPSVCSYVCLSVCLSIGLSDILHNEEPAARSCEGSKSFAPSPTDSSLPPRYFQHLTKVVILALRPEIQGYRKWATSPTLSCPLPPPPSLPSASARGGRTCLSPSPDFFQRKKVKGEQATYHNGKSGILETW